MGAVKVKKQNGCSQPTPTAAQFFADCAAAAADGKLRLPPRERKYPQVFCLNHGIQPAHFICEHVRDEEGGVITYTACEHVVGGETPLIFDPPKEDYDGIAFCGDNCYGECVSRAHDKFYIVCVESLTTILGDRLTNGEAFLPC